MLPSVNVAIVLPDALSFNKSVFDVAIGNTNSIFAVLPTVRLNRNATLPFQLLLVVVTFNTAPAPLLSASPCV